MSPQESTQITPEEIINFLLDEMEAGMSPSFYSNLVPSVYDVYLYIDDFERLRPLEQRIREEAIHAFNEKLAELNKSGESKFKLPLPALPGGKPKRAKRYETLGDWTIEFHENTDEDAKENPLVIHSTFPFSNSLPEDRAGTMTERITKRRIDGQTSTSTTTATSASTSTERSGAIDTRRASGIVYANLTYDDDAGPHTFQMTKDLIKIGRGAADRWVDLKVKSKKDVSREHLQIRRDPATGHFFVKDVSSLGTTINGKRVPSSMQMVNGQEVDSNIEVQLPEKAEIGLAGVMTIDFKAIKQR